MTYDEHTYNYFDNERYSIKIVRPLCRFNWSEDKEKNVKLRFEIRYEENYINGLKPDISEPDLNRL